MQCYLEWITVMVCVHPTVCTHSFNKESAQEGGNLWLRKWYLPGDRLQIIMHFWVTVKNRFLVFKEICFRDFTVIQSNCTSQGLRIVVTWKKQACVWPEKKKRIKNKTAFFLQLNKPTNQNWIQNSCRIFIRWNWSRMEVGIITEYQTLISII